MENGNKWFSVRNGSWKFFVSDKVNVSLFRVMLPMIDALLTEGEMLKSSRTTCAAVREIPGCGSVFLKRANNKSFRFTVRYLFRRARVFRAARAAVHLLKNSIPTPGILAVGEKRSCFFILRSGYLMTEAYPDALDAELYLYHADDPVSALDRVLNEFLPLIGRMHACGLAHRDCKLSNLYFRNGGKGLAGVWDLDGARISKLVSDEDRLRDLARFCASILSVCAIRKTPYLLDVSELCARVMKFVSVPGKSVLDASMLESSVRKFLPRA